jgi:hypothetical protein
LEVKSWQRFFRSSLQTSANATSNGD